MEISNVMNTYKYLKRNKVFRRQFYVELNYLPKLNVSGFLHKTFSGTLKYVMYLLNFI